ncbi:HAD family hydrolase [Candidatus Thorarchaeota archaeon]|nr:MAG: HAD family hydrolase [Candidatus Thorarchaeota archaeon]
MAAISLAKYEAVIFDLDSTLTDTKHYPLTASRWLLEQIGPQAQARFDEYASVLLERYFSQIREVVEGGPYKYPLQIVRDALSWALQDIGISFKESLPGATANLFKEYHLELSEAQPGVLDLLRLFEGEGLDMGVITNAFVGHIKPILTRLGIAHFFECFVDGGVVKAYKPSPAPFEFTMRQLGSEPSTTLFVGDEFYADIVGATNLGIDSIWINGRDRSLEDLLREHGEQSRPILVAESVEDLVGLLS